jgi:Mn-dependent DtxR family transcriptional regulator
MNGDQRECEILKTLARYGSLHVMRIAREVDDHPISVDRTCTRLYNAGHISPCGRGQYRLTNDGRQRLTDTHNRNV